jgi:hypothetical protein
MSQGVYDCVIRDGRIECVPAACNCAGVCKCARSERPVRYSVDYGLSVTDPVASPPAAVNEPAKPSPSAAALGPGDRAFDRMSKDTMERALKYAAANPGTSRTDALKAVGYTPPGPVVRHSSDAAIRYAERRERPQRSAPRMTRDQMQRALKYQREHGVGPDAALEALGLAEQQQPVVRYQAESGVKLRPLTKAEIRARAQAGLLYIPQTV